MNEQQIVELASRFTAFTKGFRRYFATACGFGHLLTYSRGLMSDLERRASSRSP